MVTQEFFDIVYRSLEHVKPLLPSGSKLLFESIVDDMVLLENMANQTEESENTALRELRIMEMIAESANGKNSGLYNECFVLVELSAEDSSVYNMLKKELIIPSPELHDVDSSHRIKAVEEWLMEEDSHDKEEFFCDNFAEDILSSGECVYVPNRIPARYDSPVPGITFMSVF